MSVAAVTLLAISTSSVASMAWTVNRAQNVAAERARALSLQAASRPAPPPPRAHVEPPPQPSQAHVEPPRPPPSPPPPRVEAAAPVFSLAALGSPTHETAELWARARKLGAAGIDVVLSDVQIAPQRLLELGPQFDPLAEIKPAPGSGGVKIASLAQGSLGRAVGLSEGDVVTAVNGFALTGPGAVLSAYATLRRSTAAVLEIERAGRPFVIKVTWGKAIDTAPPDTTACRGCVIR
jgi:hypothetical protein